MVVLVLVVVMLVVVVVVVAVVVKVVATSLLFAYESIIKLQLLIGIKCNFNIIHLNKYISLRNDNKH